MDPTIPISKSAASGGIIHMCASTMVAAYFRKVSVDHPLGAELWALLKGIELCLQMRLKSVIIEGDCLILINHLKRRVLYLGSSQ